MKVTGSAHYSAEIELENIAYAVLVKSTIAKGRITNIDVTGAENAPGVLAVITHLNAPKLNNLEEENFAIGKLGEKLLLYQVSDKYDANEDSALSAQVIRNYDRLLKEKADVVMYSGRKLFSEATEASF